MDRFSKCLAAVLVVLLVTATLGESVPERVRIRTLAIGETAPDFNLPGVDGRYYKLADFAKAEVLVIIFTCNHCPTAQAYEERIKKLAADYKDEGVTLVAISPNDPNALRLDELAYSDLGDSFEEMKIRAIEKGFNFPYLYDGDKQEVCRAYGPIATPHVFIFDRQRKLQYVGRFDDSDRLKRVKLHNVRDAVDALLAGKPISVQRTRPIGCSIKWSHKRNSVEQTLERWAKENVTLEIIDEDGIKAIIKNDSKKLRLINIWASWCGPCAIEFPQLVAINRMYRGRNFELVTISADSPGTKDKVLSFLKKQQASGRNYLFNSDDKYKLLEAVDEDWPGGIPYTLLVEPGGKVIYSHVGIIDPLKVKKVIVGHLGRHYQ